MCNHGLNLRDRTHKKLLYGWNRSRRSSYVITGQHDLRTFGVHLHDFFSVWEVLARTESSHNGTALKELRKYIRAGADVVQYSSVALLPAHIIVLCLAYIQMCPLVSILISLNQMPGYHAMKTKSNAFPNGSLRFARLSCVPPSFVPHRLQLQRT